VLQRRGWGSGESKSSTEAQGLLGTCARVRGADEVGCRRRAAAAETGDRGGELTEGEMDGERGGQAAQDLLLKVNDSGDTTDDRDQVGTRRTGRHRGTRPATRERGSRGTRGEAAAGRVAWKPRQSGQCVVLMLLVRMGGGGVRAAATNRQAWVGGNGRLTRHARTQDGAAWRQKVRTAGAG
jgi:hypothetical protein